MNRFIYILLILALAVGLDARPSSGSRSSGGSSRSSSSGSRSYGSTRTFSSSNSSSSRTKSSGWGSSASKPRAATSYGTTSSFTSSAKKGWGSAKAIPVPRSQAEVSVNRTLAQTSSGGVSRAQAVQERSVAMGSSSPQSTQGSYEATARQRYQTYSTPIGYNSRVSYSRVRTYHHYYDYQPSIWPYDIPSIYMWGGMRRSIIWDPFYHSYGWYAGNRQFVYYDAVVSNDLTYDPSYDQGYVDQTQYAQASAAQMQQPVVVQRVMARPMYVASTGSSGAFFIFLILFLVIMGLIIWYAVRRTKHVVAREDVFTPSTIPSAGRTSYQDPEVSDEPQKEGTLGAITKGSIIRLSDEVSMKDAASLDSQSIGLIVVVEEVLLVKEKSGLINWTFLFGTSEFENQRVLIKIKDTAQRGSTERAIVCYTKDVEGTRQELVNNDDLYLFCEPADPEHFDVAALRYAKSFVKDMGEGNESFGMIVGHELHGNCLDKLTERVQLATIAEYRNANSSTNEYLILETGPDLRTLVQGWWGDAVPLDKIEFIGK